MNHHIRLKVLTVTAGLVASGGIALASNTISASDFLFLNAPTRVVVSNDMSTGGNLSVSGDLNFGASRLFENGNFNISTPDQFIFVNPAIRTVFGHDASIGGNLAVMGGTQLNGSATITGNSTITGTLTGLTGLTVASGAVSLPAASLQDAALSSNVVLKNVTNSFSVGQIITGNSTLNGTLTGLTGLTVASGGETITSGGLTVTAGAINFNSNGITNVGVLSGVSTINAGNTLTVTSGGANITGNSTITGTLTGLTGLTVASGGATITAGGLTVNGGAIKDTAGPIVGFQPANMTFSATPAFDSSTGNTVRMVLTANVTSSTIVGSPQAGQQLTLELQQDATGSRTMVWPAGVKLAGGAFTLTTTASKTDTVTLVFDGTNWIEIARSSNI